MYSKERINSFVQKSPLLKKVIAAEPVIWLNDNYKTTQRMPHLPFTMKNILEAEELWKRFIPFFEKAFPETRETGGILESPLVDVPEMKKQLEKGNGDFSGRFMVKCDNALPVVGSIKARGGFFEVLHYAEQLVQKADLLKDQKDYSCFATTEFKEFFKKYKIGVASTGNLGLSIGTLSATLGFNVTVYVSHDAKTWKKELLKERGANVVEYPGDFSEAITEGRRMTKKDASAYFVDDENSHELYLGYSVGALRLSKQLEEKGIRVDKDHPLFVYSPCGVGGSPGGTAFGLKQIYGDNVHIFFVEPTHSPSVLVGLLTGEMSNIKVQDIGLDGLTEADGLAVARPSNFATQLSSHLISGIYTIDDDRLYALLAELMDTEGLFLEPSATSGLIGPEMVAKTDYVKKHRLNMENATHIAWSTGGDLVPDHERKSFYERGKTLV